MKIVLVLTDHLENHYIKVFFFFEYIIVRISKDYEK